MVILFSHTIIIIAILFILQIKKGFCKNTDDTEDIEQCRYILQANKRSSSAGIDSGSDDNNIYKTYEWKCSNNEMKSQLNDVNFCNGSKNYKKSLGDDKVLANDERIIEKSGNVDLTKNEMKDNAIPANQNGEKSQMQGGADHIHKNMNKIVSKDSKTLTLNNRITDSEPVRAEDKKKSEVSKKNDENNIKYGEVDYSDMDIEDYSVPRATYGNDRYIAPFEMIRSAASDDTENAPLKSKEEGVNRNKLEKKSVRGQKKLKSKIPIVDAIKKSQNKKNVFKINDHKNKQASVDNHKKVKKQKAEDNTKVANEETRLRYPADIISDEDLFDTWIELKMSLRRKLDRNRVYYYGAMHDVPSNQRNRRRVHHEALDKRSLLSSGDDMCKTLSEFTDLEKVDVVDRITQYVSNAEQKLPLAEGILK